MAKKTHKNDSALIGGSCSRSLAHFYPSGASIVNREYSHWQIETNAAIHVRYGGSEHASFPRPAPSWQTTLSQCHIPNFRRSGYCNDVFVTFCWRRNDVGNRKMPVAT
eukprot:2606806-Rhodomonas_salina.3